MRRVDQGTVVITGATSGLGRYLAERLAAMGAQVVVHGRDAARADRVAVEIRSATGNSRVDTVVADLGRLSECDRLATELAERFDRIDVLVNNAGVGFGTPSSGREFSADGIELRLAVNYLACYHLTRRLVPLLISSAPARVVNVVSAGQHPIDFDDPMLDRGYNRVVAYRRAKLALVMFTLDLADQLRSDRVTVNAVHPASHMDTPMVRQAGAEILSTVEEGAAATMRLIADPELADMTGQYFAGTQVARAHDQAYDPDARARLRTLSDQLIADTLR